MTILDVRRPPQGGATRAADLDVVLPVHNEAHVLEAHVIVVRHFLDSLASVQAMVTIADNASTDGTRPLAADLAASMPGVRAIHLDEKGRGRALRTAWSSSPATVLAYMDIDLSTSLDALMPMVAPLLAGRADVALGSRLAPGAHVMRSLKRESISRIYNGILRAFLAAGFTDAQCGFKAVRSDAARHLLPLVVNENWFFDTELLVQAQRHGYRFHEVPVCWVEDPDSRVHLVHTAVEDLKGVWRLRHQVPVPAGLPVR